MFKVTLISAIVLFAVGQISAQDPLRAIAVINGPDGVTGNVTFSQNGCGSPVTVEISVIGLAPGDHGFHIHEKGDLSNGCLSTGGHYNPDKFDHGAPEDKLRHVGDLGNVRVNEQGYAGVRFTDEVITLTGPRSIIGRGVVIHTGTDDLGKTDHPDSKKTGNAGGRAGCGVVGILDPSSSDWPCSGAAQFMLSSLCLVSILLHSINII